MKSTYCLVFALFSIVLGANAEKNDFGYVGVKKCKICHSTDKKAGTHYKVWSEMKHAKAYQALLTDEAKEAAKKHGIDDPSKDERCLSCHTTKGYLKPHDKGGYEAAVGLGLVRLRTLPKEEAVKVCTKCHKEDPYNEFYREFNYEEYFAKIDHSKATSPEVLAKRKKE
jgi:nitrate/TMAO reductase-like tetraheme cytochrome c subunit